MSQYLPTAGFRIWSSEEVEALDLVNLSDESDDGYIYEVDLHYPTELHDDHDDYPLAAESLTINSSLYSPAQQSVFPKSVHVHVRVLTFKQSPWLKSYIDFNTHHRSFSDSSFLKDFFKVMNNSVFGKTQENLWNRVQVDVVTDAATLRKRICKPSFIVVCRFRKILQLFNVEYTH